MADKVIFGPDVIRPGDAGRIEFEADGVVRLIASDDEQTAITDAGDGLFFDSEVNADLILILGI